MHYNKGVENTIKSLKANEVGMSVTEEILQNRDRFVKLTASDPSSGEYKKVVVRPIIIKNKKMWQAERFKGAQVFHLNLDETAINEYIDRLTLTFGQLEICFTDKNVSYFFNDGKQRKRKETRADRTKPDESHDRNKNFILREGEPVPALVDLGVFTPDYKVVKGMYDKFKQINRFIEMIDDKFKTVESSCVNILDFGCGKSYLTFIVYYYFVHVKKIDAHVIGYDLKSDVVDKCNKIAEKYGYADLKFYVNDVTEGLPFTDKVDAVISLHACDIATDYAIYFAIKHKVKYLFSVPCCQHEVNLSINSAKKELSPDFNLLLDYGLIKERFSALLTDSVRAHILTDFGYSVDVNEFVDFEHSPKNVMIRAELVKKPHFVYRDELLRLREKYGFNQRLLSMVYIER